MALIPLDEAVSRIVAGLRPVGAETVALAEAWGRVTALPVVARLNQPPADMSAMDGYALRHADGALGQTLRVVGEAPAGHPWTGVLGPGEAIRLYTGSVVPRGADTILIQEDATRVGDQVTVGEATTPRRHIRRQGQDFSLGEAVLPAGRCLTARDIGLAAAANHPWLIVHRRPVVAILATGDEISLPGEPIAAGGIVSSNAHALAALVRAQGGQPLVLPIAADDIAAIAAAADLAAHADLLLTTGGASVGDHDLVVAALASRGLVVDFWKIAMRPGKPLMHGRLGSTPVIGLPGNPVSAIICAIRFVIPALARLAGKPDPYLPVERGVLSAPLEANDQRYDHLRATLTDRPGEPAIVTVFAAQASSLLGLLARADALLLRPAHAPALPAGADVPVVRLAPLGV
jgi:molybdopterin molybdotransferase